MKPKVTVSTKHILKEDFFPVSLFPIEMLPKSSKTDKLKGFCHT